jgi:hypothetical protein
MDKARPNSILETWRIYPKGRTAKIVRKMKTSTFEYIAIAIVALALAYHAYLILTTLAK